MKRAMTLFLMTALLFSIASGGISQINFSQKANAQNSSAAASACQKLPIASVSANGNDGNVPANVLDNNLNTRWSNLGVGSFIQADLGGQKTICSVDIAWYRGNLRVNDFVISVSSDGTSFTNVFTGKSSGTTLSAEKYAFPSVTASFVRITVKGNTENNWASITELSVDATSNNPNTNCIKLPISSVTASATGDADDHNGPDHDADDGNVPANVLDNNLNTSLSDALLISFIQADLGGQKTICSVDIAWYRGNLRVNDFVISVSSDGTSFTNVFTGKSSGTTLSAEKYTFPSVTASFVRITVKGNTENNWASITELSVDGASNTPNTNCIKLPISSVTASAAGDADDHNGPDHDADDGNLPANVLDNNLNTRWSNLGVGSFIQANLGGQKTICSVDIAWYRGNLRVNNFVISVSNDGTSFTNVFTGKSSGTSLSAETYIIPTNVTARFVRITVNGNTENNWASITELSVDGSSSSPNT